MALPPELQQDQEGGQQQALPSATCQLRGSLVCWCLEAGSYPLAAEQRFTRYSFRSVQSVGQKRLNLSLERHLLIPLYRKALGRCLFVVN